MIMNQLVLPSSESQDPMSPPGPSGKANGARRVTGAEAARELPSAATTSGNRSGSSFEALLSGARWHELWRLLRHPEAPNIVRLFWFYAAVGHVGYHLASFHMLGGEEQGLGG